MFRLAGTISDEDKAAFDESISILWNDYKIEQVEPSRVSEITQLLKGYEILKGWTEVTLGIACMFSRDNKQAFYCVPVMDKVIEGVGSKGQRYTHHINETYQLFLVDLEKDLGRILMRPETIADMISELFGNIDIDFRKHPKFSKNYFVLAATPDDEKMFRKNVSGKMLDAIAEHKGLQIEIKDKKMLVMTGKTINPADAKMLAELAFSL